MSINNNVTFRRKHRPVWYGMLCLVLITAAVLAVGLLPMQSSDLSSAESEESYTLSVDGNYYDTNANLEDLIAEIEGSDGTDFTITVNSDKMDFSGFELNLGEGKKVTLTSSSDEPFTLTVTKEDKRHFTVISGTLILEKIILDGKKTGGGIEVKAPGKLIMNKGAVIQKCKAENGGGVYNDGGTFTMNGGIIKDNVASADMWSSGNGGGVYNDGNTASATFTMTGGEISGNIANYRGGGVCNDDSTFTMTGGVISENTSRYGGGVYNDNSTLTMTGGVISGNVAATDVGSANGGGVYNIVSTFIMKKGEISGNTATYEGGGVWNRYTLFIMDEGTISKNKALLGPGGGVYTNYNSYPNNEPGFTMNGGVISGNTANNEYEGGGGVMIYGGTFIMNKGKISDNESTSKGGGVHNDYSGKFEMNSGVISGNKAANGGGVYNASSGTFTMNGGVISSNTAKLGGGVYNWNGKTNIIGGKISDNTATGADSAESGGRGSGGGVYTTDYTKLTVIPADGEEVIFSGNKAPTLRTKNIDDDAVLTYHASNIDDKVVLSGAPTSLKLNAPAYNNFDINYSGDSYVVELVIGPNSGGSIIMTYNGKDTLYENEYVLFPLSGQGISLSAVPKSGYEFKQFVIDGSKANVGSIAFKVSGNFTVVAEFSLISTQPEQKDNIITATAESGSEITPSGAVKVPYGESKTFTFSAKLGYKITAVLVDGIPISSAELASGEYTFRDVKSGHEIEVVSEADDGSDVGAGGNDMGAGGSGGWIVLGMVCVMLLIFSGAVVLIARKDRLRTGSGPEQP